MRRLALLAALIFLACSLGYARLHSQSVQLMYQDSGTAAPTTCVGYTGLGDILTFNAYYGMRPYSAASVGPTSAKAVQVVRASDSATQDINVLCNSGAGAFDRASLITFADTSASCTGSITLTTLTITACSSGTIALGDLVTGTGVSTGTVVTVIGTCGAGAGSCTVNNSQTVVSETITTKTPPQVQIWYDQSGNALDQLFIGAAGHRAKISWAAVGIFPCGIGVGGGYAATIPSTASRPISYTAVLSFVTGVTQTVITVNNNDNAGDLLKSTNSTVSIWESAELRSGALTDGNFAAVSALANGASSALEVNGTRTTGNTGSTTTPEVKLALMSNAVNGQVSNSTICEAGAIFGSITSGNQTSLDTNMRAYYGNLF